MASRAWSWPVMTTVEGRGYSTRLAAAKSSLVGEAPNSGAGRSSCSRSARRRRSLWRDSARVKTRCTTLAGWKSRRAVNWADHRQVPGHGKRADPKSLQPPSGPVDVLVMESNWWELHVEATRRRYGRDLGCRHERQAARHRRHDRARQVLPRSAAPCQGISCCGWAGTVP